MASDPYLSEIRFFAFDFMPPGWALCNGQYLPIDQNQALFSLLGTAYGGNGQTTFALPDLRGRVPCHVGRVYMLGERIGEERHRLSEPEMAEHVHYPNASGALATSSLPTGNVLAAVDNTTFGSAYAGGKESVVTMATQSIASTGGSQEHPNVMPYLVLNACICLQGMYPPTSS